MGHLFVGIGNQSSAEKAYKNLFPARTTTAKHGQILLVEPREGHAVGIAWLPLWTARPTVYAGNAAQPRQVACAAAVWFFNGRARHGNGACSMSLTKVHRRAPTFTICQLVHAYHMQAAHMFSSSPGGPVEVFEVCQITHFEHLKRTRYPCNREISCSNGPEGSVPVVHSCFL